MDRLHRAGRMLADPGFLGAALTWPRFSVTSFLMTSSLARLGLDFQTIVDVGANIGQFSIAAGRRFPRAAVHSYEPLPEAYAKLTAATGKMPNVTARQIALGDTTGSVAFHVNTHAHSSSALRLEDTHKRAFPFAREASEITVSVSTLDEEYRDHRLRHPILLKLDVQGYEARVLRGGARFLADVDYVLIELSLTPLYQGEENFLGLLTQLSDSGFDFHQPIDLLRDPRSGRVLQMDGFFVKRSTMNSEAH